MRGELHKAKGIGKDSGRGAKALCAGIRCLHVVFTVCSANDNDYQVLRWSRLLLMRVFSKQCHHERARAKNDCTGEWGVGGWSVSCISCLKNIEEKCGLGASLRILSALVCMNSFRCERSKLPRRISKLGVVCPTGKPCVYSKGARRPLYTNLILSDLGI